jgi:hypothetical protein
MLVLNCGIAIVAKTWGVSSDVFFSKSAISFFY